MRYTDYQYFIGRKILGCAKDPRHIMEFLYDSKHEAGYYCLECNAKELEKDMLDLDEDVRFGAINSQEERRMNLVQGI